MACAWSVGLEPGNLAFFGLLNDYIESLWGSQGVLGVPVDGLEDCTSVIDGAGIDEIEAPGGHVRRRCEAEQPVVKPDATSRSYSRSAAPGFTAGC